MGPAPTRGTCCPVPQFDVEAALETVRPIVDDVRDRGADAVLEWGERLDGVRPPSLRVPVATLQQALADLDPAVRAALEESIRRARLVHADQRRTDATTQVVPGGTVTERWVPVERVGLYVPGGRAVYPSQRRHERRAGAGGRRRVARRGQPAAAATSAGCRTPRSWPPARCSASTRCTPSAAPRRSRCSAYGTEECLRPVDMVTGPGQHLRRRRQAAAQGPHRHRRRGRPDRDRHPRRRHRRPGARRRRPDQPGRARRRSRPRCSSPTAQRSPTRSRQSWRVQVAATKHSERVAEALAGPQSARSCSSTTSTPACAVVDAYAAEHLEIQTRDAAAVAARVRNAGAIFVGPWSPVSLGRLPAPAPTTCCRPVAAPATPRPVGAVVPARDPRRRLRASDALRRVAHHVVALARRRGPACARAGGPGPVPAVTALEVPEPRRAAGPRGPARPDRRTARLSWTSPVRLNTNENPFTRCPGARGRRGAARSPTPRRAQPLPRPGRGRRCAADLADYLTRVRTCASRPSTCGRPTAPTRSCSSCCRRSAGPGRTRWASRRRTRCIPTTHRHRHPLGHRAPRAPTSVWTPQRAVEAVREHQPDVVFAGVARTTRQARR